MFRRRRTIRFRLMVGFIAIVLIAYTILSVVTVVRISHVLVGEIQTRVRLDLNSARQVYNGYVERIAEFLAAASTRRVVPEPTAESVRGDLGELLQVLRLRGGLDILTLVGPDGRVIFRAHNPAVSGDPVGASNPVLSRALTEWAPVSGTFLMSADALGHESPELADRARIALRPTPSAAPTDELARTDGMVLAAAVPLVDIHRPDEHVGLLYGAILLNGRNDIVDAIKDSVFQGQTVEGVDIGTATIFERDVRIATNVRDADGERAIGTRLSEAVQRRVLDEGEAWADRAFVVNDWYITAYEPIRDPSGAIIGALYVGLLERPFLAVQERIFRVFFPVVALVALVTLLLLFILTRQVLRPIDQVVEMSQRVVGGDLSARVGIRPAGEMGLLCRAVDQMAEAVEEREKELQRATQEQIGQSEKLAAIGRLAAGVAHEINNPLTGVLTFAHLLRDNPKMGDPERADIKLIIRETTRVREIVRSLLDFARESPSAREPVDLNEVIRTTTTLLRGQKAFRNIDIEEHLVDEPPVIAGDRNQLQQVILNLVLNACEAMPDGGTLTLETRLVGGEVILTVRDTGVGIADEHVEKVFDPFFTTKPVGKGTGLGLSVTYGIIQGHGGSIGVQSRPGRGSAFTVRLPTSDGSGPDGDQ